MAKELRPKFDPNKEAFQMRAQWKKMENCTQQWHNQWSWLLDERKQTQEEARLIREEATASLPHVITKTETDKTLKPVPVTTTGFIGWISTKPDCQLEIYTSWLNKIPIRLPDTWDHKGYVGTPQQSK